jgi:hypothetical protein
MGCQVKLTMKLPATIDIFWLTEQRETITPSLQSLQSIRRSTLDDGAKLKRTLYEVLLEGSNVSVFLKYERREAYIDAETHEAQTGG